MNYTEIATRNIHLYIESSEYRAERSVNYSAKSEPIDQKTVASRATAAATTREISTAIKITATQNGLIRL